MAEVVGPFVLRVPGPVGPPPPRHVPLPDTSDPPRCDHPRTEVRRMRQSNGVFVARTQCLTCGAGIQNVRKDSVPDFDALPAFDEPLREAWRSRVDRYYADRRAAAAS